jgi:hypothetical protein
MELSRSNFCLIHEGFSIVIAHLVPNDIMIYVLLRNGFITQRVHQSICVIELLKREVKDACQTEDDDLTTPPMWEQNPGAVGGTLTYSQNVSRAS